MLKHLAEGSIRHAISLSRCRFLETVAITSIRSEITDSDSSQESRAERAGDSEVSSTRTWQRALSLREIYTDASSWRIEHHQAAQAGDNNTVLYACTLYLTKVIVNECVKSYREIDATDAIDELLCPIG